MFKLYKLDSLTKEYWETWDNNDGTHTVHWGVLGTEGQSKIVKGSFLRKPETIIQKEIDQMVSCGFRPAEAEFILLIEYSVDGMGSGEDVSKRHRLEERMNETLGWTGLGNCDGGSIGSGTMEICNFVVNFDIARKVIENDLKGTEFQDYTRIYCGEHE